MRLNCRVVLLKKYNYSDYCGCILLHFETPVSRQSSWLSRRPGDASKENPKRHESLSRLETSQLQDSPRPLKTPVWRRVSDTSQKPTRSEFTGTSETSCHSQVWWWPWQSLQSYPGYYCPNYAEIRLANSNANLSPKSWLSGENTLSELVLSSVAEELSVINWKLE